ncbi:CG2736, partial [Drosophila busckii]
AKCCVWLKIIVLALCCGLNITLFILSYGISYQHLLTEQHIQFREVMPTMDEWINSPYGKLKSYLFNVTNSEEFLSGLDDKVKLEEVGPITYKMLGFNDIQHRNESSVTYQKHRYRHVEFWPEESVSPDILNKTIIQFNTVLIGAAATLAPSLATVPFSHIAFNSLTLSEPLFVPGSVYYFLWEFTRPTLQFLSKITSLSTNCGTLHNALMEKQEIYTVNIGPKHGVENFFRLQSFNNEQLIKERRELGSSDYDPSCPINVTGTLDNSLYPPYLQKETPLSIVATESCRVLPLHYQHEQQHEGFANYRYTLLRANQTPPSCMSKTYGVPLPPGMFDVSKCIVNDAPSAFSMPHFYGSGYNWSEHFEGLTPNVDDHEPYILLEPITGIPTQERYRFQTNTPLPDLSNFNRLGRLSHMILPGFWYEYETGSLSDMVLFLMHIQVDVVPVLQPILMTVQLLLAAWSLLSLIRICSNSESYGELYQKTCCRTTVLLEITFNQKRTYDPNTRVK